MNEKDKQALYAILRKHLTQIEAERYFNQITAKAAGCAPTHKDIKESVTAYFNLKDGQLESEGRSSHLAYARHIAMYLCYMMSEASYPQIGRMFGGRDHTSVLYGVHRVRDTAAMKAIADDIRATLLGEQSIRPATRARLKEIVLMDGVNYAA